MKKVFIEVPEGADREPYIAHLESLGYVRRTHVGAYTEERLRAFACCGNDIGWEGEDLQWLLDNGYEQIEMPQQNHAEKQHPHKEAVEKWLSDTTQRVWAFVDKWVEIAITTLVNDAIGHHVEIRVQHDSPKKQIKIGEIWIDEPEREPLAQQQVYYTTIITYDSLFMKSRWDGGNVDLVRLKRGLIHLTKEAAIAHAKALIALTGECE